MTISVFMSDKLDEPYSCIAHWDPRSQLVAATIFGPFATPIEVEKANDANEMLLELLGTVG